MPLAARNLHEWSAHAEVGEGFVCSHFSVPFRHRLCRVRRDDIVAADRYRLARLPVGKIDRRETSLCWCTDHRNSVARAANFGPASGGMNKRSTDVVGICRDADVCFPTYRMTARKMTISSKRSVVRWGRRVPFRCARLVNDVARQHLARPHIVSPTTEHAGSQGFFCAPIEWSQVDSCQLDFVMSQMIGNWRGRFNHT